MNKLLFISLMPLVTLSGFAGTVGTEPNIQEKMSQLLTHVPTMMNVFKANDEGLNKGHAWSQAWSGSYWPDIRGNIADHYRSHKTAGAKVSFLFNYGLSKKALTRDFSDVQQNYLSWQADEMNQKFSAAEKYDFAFGDTSFTFTRAILEEVDFRAHHKLSNGNWIKDGNSFALWSGICDGWAPASLYLPRPVKPVTVIGAHELPITFYPEDIKALGSYLFARTNTSYMTTMNYQFAGKRCNARSPNRDRAGKIEDSKCNDLDAGVWHTALLNRIGIDRVGFILELDNNTKVNNHPAYAYELKYYNPNTGKEGNLNESVVSIFSLKKDGYRDRRNTMATQVVGVKSKVYYGNYIWPEDRRNTTTDSPEEDKIKTVDYVYDLELDSDGNILGGEWGNRSEDRPVLGKVRKANQPDFIWMANPKFLPFSENSTWAEKNTYDGKVMPKDWREYALKDAKWIPPAADGTSVLKSAQPFSHFVYYLFEEAKE